MSRNVSMKIIKELMTTFKILSMEEKRNIFALVLLLIIVEVLLKDHFYVLLLSEDNF